MTKTAAIGSAKIRVLRIAVFFLSVLDDQHANVDFFLTRRHTSFSIHHVAT